MRGDSRSFVLWIARVQNEDRNVLLYRREHGRRMQHLGAEIGEFCGFIEADDLDPVCLGADARVSGLHSIYIGPNLDAFGSESRAHDGGREISTAAANSRHDPIFRG